MGKKYSDGKNYKVVAFILACFSAEAQKELIKIVTKKSREHHCKVVFFSTLSTYYEMDPDEGEIRIFDMVQVEKYDAVVLMSETFKVEDGQAELVRRATEAGVPVIAVDHYVKGCINITFDYKEAFREIVKHMVEVHGYRDLSFMGGGPDNSFSNDLLEAYKEVLEQNKISFDPARVYHGYFWEKPTVAAMDKMLQENPVLPRAIICANDTMALTVCEYLRQRGFRVPEDVAVSGFDGLEAGIYHKPQLLTSVYDSALFSDELFRLINSGFCINKEQNLKVAAYNRMQIGGSCGCQGIEGADAAAKIIQIKSELYHQMEYQTLLGKMVAGYGNDDGMEIVQKVIPNRLKKINYTDFWLCSGKRLLVSDYPFGISPIRSKNFGPVCHTIHFKNQDNGEKINYIEQEQNGNLIPNMEEYLEADVPLLVITIPAKEAQDVYAVISMENEQFWYMGCASFVLHLRFLLDMQYSKKLLMQLYRTDALTGVLNRNGFYDMVNQMLQNSIVRELTIISLDMCDFKKINDTYGHAEGDEALKAVGTILKDSIERREIAARIGGDEFLIALFGNNQKTRSLELVEELNKKTEAFNSNCNKGYKLIFSIGVHTEEMEEHSLDYFLQKADKKMYEHKNEQKQNKLSVLK